MNLIETLRARRAAVKAALLATLDAAEQRDIPGLTDAERVEADANQATIAELDARIAELVEMEVREAAALAASPAPKQTATVSVTNEPNPVYRKNDSSSPSFFRDLAFRNTDQDAMRRLFSAQETRAGDMTTVAGAGGQLAPPSWLIGDFIALARPARPAADLIGSRELPSGVASINLPKISGGTTAAIQTTQNTAVSDTAMTTTSVSSGISTIAGKQIVSMQLIQQGGTPIDEVVISDLALAYAGALDVQVLAGSGSSGQLRGLQNGASVGGTTFTSASPAVTSATAANSFYNKLVSAMNTIFTARYLPATAILMHPQRWSWVLEGLDTATRPLIVPDGPMFNGVGTSGSPTLAQGAAGTLLGLPVYLDPNITVTNNSNQDICFVLRKEDVWLYESPLQQASFDATYADQASILFRVLGYSAMIPDRYGASVNLITGTGMVSPTL